MAVGPGQSVGADVAELAASGAHVAQQQTVWTQMKSNAAAGELRFEQGAAEQCAAALDTLNDQIDVQLHEAHRLLNVEGFGPTLVGGALSRKFAAQGEVALKVLAAHQALLKDMASTFRQAGKNYHETEMNNQRRTDGVG